MIAPPFERALARRVIGEAELSAHGDDVLVEANSLSEDLDSRRGNSKNRSPATRHDFSGRNGEPQ